jgi:hypothetical protein
MKKTPGAQGAKFSAPTTQTQIGGLKLKPAAIYLGGLSVPTMHRLIKRGLLKPNRATRHLLFPLSELERFLKDGMT